MSSQAPPSYRAVLRTPQAARTFAPALLGRLSYGTVALALLLSVRRSTGSYAAAGLVMALFGAASVVLSPARAALLDRYGVRRALPPMSALYALLLCSLAALTHGPGPVGTAPVFVLATLAGAATPPLGPVMRTLWSRLLPDRDLLRRAYGLDAVAEELLFLSGPLIVGALLTRTGPAAGLVLSAVLVLLGACGMATSPVAAVREGAAVPEERAGRRGLRPRRPRGLPAPLLRVVLVLGGVGLCLGALDLLVLAYAEEHRSVGAVPWILAALSAGSAVGGLVQGALPGRGTETGRLLLCAGALGGVLAVAGLAPGTWALGAVVAVAGLFFAPAMATAYLAADEHAAPEHRTRTGAWVNTGFNAGSSGGTALVGVLLGALPLAVCFALAALPVLGAVLWGATAWGEGPAEGGGPEVPATAGEGRVTAS